MANDACLRCGTTMQDVGVEQFRVGGTSGGRKLLFGEMADLGEDMIALGMLVCSNCGYTEFRHPGATSNG